MSNQKRPNSIRLNEIKSARRGILLFFVVFFSYLAWTLSVSIVKPLTMEWSYHALLKSYPILPGWFYDFIFTHAFPFLISLLICTAIATIIFNVENRLVVSNMGEVFQALMLITTLYHLNKPLFFMIKTNISVVLALWIGTNIISRVLEALNREYIEKGSQLEGMTTSVYRNDRGISGSRDNRNLGDKNKGSQKGGGQKSSGQQGDSLRESIRSIKEDD